MLGELVLAVRQTPNIHAFATQQTSDVSPLSYKLQLALHDIKIYSEDT